MNYIGSKFSLLPDIERVLDMHNVPATGIALDLFAGTGVVAQLLKKRGHIAYANDWQCYSYSMCVAFLEHNALPEFGTLLSDGYWRKRIEYCPLVLSLPGCPAGCPSLDFDSPVAQVLSYLSQLPGKTGAFYNSYCEGGKSGRLYFSECNGLRIQSIRDQIELWGQEQFITPKEKLWLVASLIEGADRVANTASVYGAYLKRIKSTAQKPLRLYVMNPVSSVHDEPDHRAFCMDSEALLSSLNGTRPRLVYIDPPYNMRQYNANYHILETLARWDLDCFEPTGVTGLRSNKENRSDYCSRRNVEKSFRALFGLLNAEYVLFSYNNEGLVSRESLEAMFLDYCDDVHFEEIAYRRFRADNDGDNRVYKGDSTTEFLVLGKPKLYASRTIEREQDSLSTTPQFSNLS